MTKYVKAIIAGSRNLYDYDLLCRVIEYVERGHSDYHITEVVSGGARGMDACGELWARNHAVKLTTFRAHWEKYGAAAGPIRNREMGWYSDILIAIWDGKSRGTKHMIYFMRNNEKPVYVFDISGKRFHFMQKEKTHGSDNRET